MQTKLLSFLLVLCLCLSLFTGCKKEASSSAGGISYTDALGRTVSLPKKPQRVAALLGSFADLWILAGGEVCAAPEDAWEDFSLELPHAIHLGGAHSPNSEQLLASDPDLVLASASTASHVELLSLLEQTGVPVVYFDIDSFRDYLSMLELCTRLTDRRDLFEEKGLRIQQRIQTLKDDLTAQNLPEEQKRILLLRVSSGSLKAKGSTGTILGEMLADLGCINIADSNSSLLETLSVESILSLDPYRIFVVTMGSDPQKAESSLWELLQGDPAWASLEAVKAGRVHIMNRALFHTKPNERWGDSYEILYSILTETT